MTPCRGSRRPDPRIYRYVSLDLYRDLPDPSLPPTLRPLVPPSIIARKQMLEKYVRGYVVEL